MKRLSALVLILAAQLVAQESGYLGAETCRACHPQQYASQSETAHARTLFRAADHPLAEGFLPSSPLRRDPSYRLRFARHGDEIIVAGDDGEYVVEIPLEWAFGAGSHGVTFVSHLDDDLYVEHAFSYYAQAGRLDITTGHEASQPETLHQAMGMIYPARDENEGIDRCFACHSTGPLSYASDGSIQVLEAGIRCESCHGPGDVHARLVDEGKVEEAVTAIDNPARLASVELNRVCGDCHRRPESGMDQAFDYDRAWNVRHQPPYLERSRCFTESNGALSCLTCHDLHQPLVKDNAAYYRERCEGCHSAATNPPADACGASEASDCTNCHLPAVKISEHLSFRNHWIGVYDQGSPLHPRR